MGYVHDTQFCQAIPPNQIHYSAGTWTYSVASNVFKAVRTAADAAFNVHIPITIPSNAAGYKGCRLKSIDFLWTNATADLDGVATVELEKITLPANTVAVTGAAVSITVDAANDTTAKRLTQAAHTMTVTLDTPAWIDDNEMYVLLVAFDAAATSAVTVWGAKAYFDLRA